MKTSTLLLGVFASQLIISTLFRLDIYTAPSFLSLEHSELLTIVSFCGYAITDAVEGKNK